MAKLQKARAQKESELEYVNNANYTSLEEGAAISPNDFISQNRMPRRPGTKTKSQEKINDFA